MTNTPSFPPIVITLKPLTAGALVSVTNNYASVLSYESRLDYCIAEIAQWQSVRRVFLAGQSDEEIANAVRRANDGIEQLIAYSIREGLSE